MAQAADEPLLHEHKEFKNVDFSGKTLRDREFFKCTFVNCNFSKSDLSKNEFSNCTFEACNFTMAKIVDTGFGEVTFNNCKLMGLDFSSASRFMFSFAFSNSQLDYGIFHGTKLKKTVFDRCSLKDADFTDADLTQAVLKECDLQNAQFTGTNLEKTDLRTAQNYHIDPDRNKLKKTRFANTNLAGLLHKYNLDIDFEQ